MFCRRIAHEDQTSLFIETNKCFLHSFSRFLFTKELANLIQFMNRVLMNACGLTAMRHDFREDMGESKKQLPHLVFVTKKNCIFLTNIFSFFWKAEIDVSNA